MLFDATRRLRVRILLVHVHYVLLAKTKRCHPPPSFAFLGIGLLGCRERLGKELRFLISLQVAQNQRAGCSFYVLITRRSSVQICQIHWWLSVVQLVRPPACHAGGRGERYYVTARRAYRRLLLLPKHLPVGFAIGIKAIMFTRSQPAFSSGVLMSQSGRHFFNTARKSCRSSSMVGRPKNQ